MKNKPEVGQRWLFDTRECGGCKVIVEIINHPESIKGKIIQNIGGNNNGLGHVGSEITIFWKFDSWSYLKGQDRVV